MWLLTETQKSETSEYCETYLINTLTGVRFRLDLQYDYENGTYSTPTITFETGKTDHDGEPDVVKCIEMPGKTYEEALDIFSGPFTAEISQKLNNALWGGPDRTHKITGSIEAFCMMP